MIEEPPILTIRENRRKPTPQQIKALSGQPTGFLTDAMNGTGAMTPDIRPLERPTERPTERTPEAGAALPTTMCGPVLTCDTGPADILALLAAITELSPGDVMVNATGNWQQCAAAGDRVVGMLKNAGAIGFVTDGLVRDVEGIVEVGLPVFCTGLSPNSPHSKGPGSIGEPVVIGGVHVSSGDVLISDDNGVVIVPFDQIDAVIERLKVIEKLETELDAEIRDGLIVPDAIRDLVQSDEVLRLSD